MGFFRFTARQHRWISKLFGNIDKNIVLDSSEVRKLLKGTLVSKNVTVKDGQYICPDNGKVSDILSKNVHCNSFYKRVFHSFLPDGNCVWYSKEAAIQMRGYAFGVFTVRLKSGELHRMNIFINRKKEVWAWEPQLCSYPGGGVVEDKLVIHMGKGLENVGDCPEHIKLKEVLL